MNSICKQNAMKNNRMNFDFISYYSKILLKLLFKQNFDKNVKIQSLTTELFLHIDCMMFLYVNEIETFNSKVRSNNHLFGFEISQMINITKTKLKNHNSEIGLFWSYVPIKIEIWDPIKQYSLYKHFDNKLRTKWVYKRNQLFKILWSRNEIHLVIAPYYFIANQFISALSTNFLKRIDSLLNLYSNTNIPFLLVSPERQTYLFNFVDVYQFILQGQHVFQYLEKVKGGIKSRFETTSFHFDIQSEKWKYLNYIKNNFLNRIKRSYFEKPLKILMFKYILFIDYKLQTIRWEKSDVAVISVDHTFEFASKIHDKNVNLFNSLYMLCSCHGKYIMAYRLTANETFAELYTLWLNFLNKYGKLLLKIVSDTCCQEKKLQKLVFLFNKYVNFKLDLFHAIDRRLMENSPFHIIKNKKNYHFLKAQLNSILFEQKKIVCPYTNKYIRPTTYCKSVQLEHYSQIKEKLENSNQIIWQKCKKHKKFLNKFSNLKYHIDNNCLSHIKHDEGSSGSENKHSRLNRKNKETTSTGIITATYKACSYIDNFNTKTEKNISCKQWTNQLTFASFLSNSDNFKIPRLLNCFNAHVESTKNIHTIIKTTNFTHWIYSSFILLNKLKYWIKQNVLLNISSRKTNSNHKIIRSLNKFKGIPYNSQDKFDLKNLNIITIQYFQKLLKKKWFPFICTSDKIKLYTFMEFHNDLNHSCCKCNSINELLEHYVCKFNKCVFVFSPLIKQNSVDNGLFIYYSLQFFQQNTFEFINFGKTNKWFEQLFKNSLKLILLKDKIYIFNFNKKKIFKYHNHLQENTETIAKLKKQYLYGKYLHNIKIIDDKTFSFFFVTNKKCCLHCKKQDIHTFIDIYLYFQKYYLLKSTLSQFHTYVHYVLQKYFKSSTHFTESEKKQLNQIYKQQHTMYYNIQEYKNYFSKSIQNINESIAPFTLFCSTCNKGLRTQQNNVFCKCFRKIYCNIQCFNSDNNHICKNVMDARNHCCDNINKF